MSLYDKLNLDKNCSKDDIKKSFRKLAVSHHPDKGGDEEKFKEISHAYEVLSDDEKRKRYDLTGSDTEQPQQPNFNSGFPFNFGGDPFEFMFNQHHRQRREDPIRKLDDTVHTINISLKEAYFGLTKNMAVTTTTKCDCSTACGKCKGEGKFKVVQQFGPIRQVFDAQCDMCSGRGFIVKANCDKCSGKGSVNNKEVFPLDIPKNAITGLEKRISGKGQQPFKRNEIAGDLVFKINVMEDVNFKRRGVDFIYEKSISFIDSICGCEVIIPHFEGNVLINTITLGIIYEGVEYVVTSENIKNKVILCFKIEKLIKVLKEEDRSKIREILM